MKTITVYHATKVEYLFRFKPQATFWMPENEPELQNLWEPGNVIATLNDAYLTRIQVLIELYDFPAEQFLWMSCLPMNVVVAYIFDQAGNVKNFFRVE